MLKKGFLRNRIEFYKISKRDLIIGILIFLSFSSIFYFLIKFLREFHRIISALLNHNLLILSKNQNEFYNFFFAFFAVLLAQSTVITFWFNKNNKFNTKYNYKRNTIVNDNRLTVWYFFHWFGKIGIMFGMVAVEVDSMDIYNDYSYLFYLTAIVLFLQVWNSFRLIFKDKSLKWILISFITVSIFSYVLSKINLVNYDKLNDKVALQSSEYYRYDIHIPKSKIYYPIQRKNLIVDIFLYENFNNKDNIGIYFHGREIPFNQLKYGIFNLYLLFQENDVKYLNFRIHSDINTKMGMIYKIKESMLDINITRISYAVKPFNTKEPYYYKRDIFFHQETIMEQNKARYLTNNLLEIEIQESNKITINDKEIKRKEIKELVKQFIKKNEKYSILLKYNKNVKFGDYITILEMIKQEINEVKIEYGKEKYGKKFNDLSKKQKREISKLYHSNIIEQIK